ncbi:MAG: AAA family ATPase [Planctomycetes bacterium]|nr:AAA family ATPase [Planctomycetota bacterium]
MIGWKRMILAALKFTNFKALRNATLPLGSFTLIVGPNGSGKTTALQGLLILSGQARHDYPSMASVGIKDQEVVKIAADWKYEARSVAQTVLQFNRGGGRISDTDANGIESGAGGPAQNYLSRVRYYSLDPRALCRNVQLQPRMGLSEDGSGLAGVLDNLRDTSPERFEGLNAEFSRWLPEFDRILFSTPTDGARAVSLRLRGTTYGVPATEVSQGSLLALAILTLAYLPIPPSLVCFEEPDRGLHPRLLRDVRDALYRLAYPKKLGEERTPVQVVATTHSPYLLDLFKDHPEEVVIAQKLGHDAIFDPLANRPDVGDILRDSHLGDAWYSGVLGGVPQDR